jgi:hypothetical protein
VDQQEYFGMSHTTQSVARLMAKVAEDLAIELLSEFPSEDTEQLGEVVGRLQLVAQVLSDLGLAVPYVVTQLINIYGKY